VTSTIDTERLHLRPWRLDEFERFHALTAAEPMRRFLGREPPSLEDSYNRLMRNGGCWHFLGWGTFAVVERATGAIVGNCGLFRTIRGLGDDFDSYPEAGWVIADACWGRGFAAEAMTAILAWFEAEHGGGRTVAMIVPGNEPSERLAAKLGYAPFGLGEYKGEHVMRYVRG
jgi:RimJ/RimL family protein N-acetyltransferase